MQSLPEILGIVTSLNPRAGMSLTNGAMERTCSTEVFESIILNGEQIALTYNEDTNPRSKHYRRRRYIAIYVRVSTTRQSEGFSVEDQAERAIRYCIAKRRAFRIFADTGLSGSLPPAIPHLVEKMQRKRAARYETIFTNIFLSQYVTRYSEEQKQGISAYLEQRKVEILSGDGSTGEDDADLTGQIRPGLTCVIHALDDIDEVVVTDMSRLARSVAITEEVIERIIERRICLTGLIEPISDLEGIGTQVVAWQAEQFLFSLTASSIRGTLALLESGRVPCVGNIPWWCDRDSDGRAVPHPVRWQAAREIIDRFLAGEQPYDIWKWLIETDCPAPSKGREASKGWDLMRITRWLLDHPALRGNLNYYGLDWPILPPLVTEDEWWQIRQLRAKSARPKRGRKETAPRYMGTGLVRCLCGTGVHHHSMQGFGQADQYACKGARSRSLLNKSLRGGRHITIMAPHIDTFLDDLMTSHPLSLLQRYAGGKDYDPLGESIRSLSVRLENTRQDRQRTERAAREEAAALYRSAGVTEANPSFATLVLTFTDAKTVEIRETERRLEADLRVEQERQQRLQVTADWAGLTKQAERWDSLTDATKNKVLCALFVEFQWRRNEEDGTEWIVPYLRAAEPVELEHIRVNARGQKTITRTLEPASEWMARALGVTRIKTVIAGKGLGEPTLIASPSARDFQPDDDAERGVLSIHNGRVTVRVRRPEDLEGEPVEGDPDEGE
ncbi:MAG: recombinase family protein [Chthonomonadaceae bacterium]|nr:recombinase family protein [Chthonomonadaceae bacterium]